MDFTFETIEGILTLTVSILIGAALLFAFIARIIVFFGYWGANRTKVGGNLTGETAARKLLDENGLGDVRVVKANIFMAILFGNSYSARKKLIRLRGSIFNKNTVTAIGLAAQKVAMAKAHAEGDKKVAFRSNMQPLMMFAPMAFVPLVVVGIVLDIIIFKTLGIITIVAALLGVAYYLFALVLTLLTLKVERKANKEALVLISNAGMLNENETAELEKLFKYYILAYIAEFILSLLYLLKYILQLAKAVSKLKK